MNAFSLGGVRSEDYGIIMTVPPDEVNADRDVEIISVRGRNGDVIVDGGRYNNVEISYSCALIPEDDEDYRKAAIRVASFLRPTAYYQRMENTYDPEHFRLARVASAISAESIAEQAGKFSITWDCKPQLFLKSGECAIDFPEQGNLWNMTEFEALPLITVYGSGAGTVTIGDITVTIKSMDDHLVLDCELMDAYRVADSGALENKNGSIYAPKFPVLRPGENLISWTGGVERLEIIPRWWTL